MEQISHHGSMDNPRPLARYEALLRGADADVSKGESAGHQPEASLRGPARVAYL